MEGQMRNILLAFAVMWAAANVPPQTLLRLAVPIYTFGVALLVAVALFGVIKKGARRWLHVGVDIQPSEIMKIATPLMLAWYFQTRAGMHEVAELRRGGDAARDSVRPDRQAARPGHRAAGGRLRLLRDLPGRPVVEGAGRRCSWPAARLPVAWSMMHDYQRERIMTLIDPDHRPARQGLPHHPVDHRDRLGRRDPARAI
jgi:rod shape determining protein RodA